MAANDNMNGGDSHGVPWLAILVGAFLIVVAVAGFVAFTGGHADAKQFVAAASPASSSQNLGEAA